MPSTRPVVAALIALALVSTGCLGDSDGALPRPQDGTARVIDAKEGRALLDSDRGALLIDVRTVPEYITGHLVGAQSIDVSDEEAWKFRIAELDRDRPTIVYCRDSECSADAAARLVEAGLSRVYDLGFPAQWDPRYLPIDSRRTRA